MERSCAWWFDHVVRQRVEESGGHLGLLKTLSLLGAPGTPQEEPCYPLLRAVSPVTHLHHARFCPLNVPLPDAITPRTQLPAYELWRDARCSKHITTRQVAWILLPLQAMRLKLIFNIQKLQGKGRIQGGARWPLSVA